MADALFTPTDIALTRVFVHLDTSLKAARAARVIPGTSLCKPKATHAHMCVISVQQAVLQCCIMAAQNIPPWVLVSVGTLL